MKTRKHENRIGTGMITSLCVALLGFFAVTQAVAGPAAVESNAIWAHDRLYGTIGTDTEFFSPPPHSTDVIFAFGIMGQRSVAEAAPGDRDYNGGRWNVMLVTLTDTGRKMFDADHNGVLDDPDLELTNAGEVLELAEGGFLMISSAHFYFECPLRSIPTR